MPASCSPGTRAANSRPSPEIFSAAWFNSAALLRRRPAAWATATMAANSGVGASVWLHPVVQVDRLGVVADVLAGDLVQSGEVDGAAGAEVVRAPDRGEAEGAVGPA